MNKTSAGQALLNFPFYFKCMVAEFIGTFFLVLVAGMMASAGKADLAPLAIGVTLMVMVFSGGHVSGGHFNPAVTIAVWVSRAIPGHRVMLYIIAQLAAAVTAAYLTGWLSGDELRAELPALTNWWRLPVAELLGTFALVYTVLNVAVSKATVNNGFYGLAIGLTVTAMAYALGGLSGGMFNPALVLGFWSGTAISTPTLVTYLAGQFVGALLAAKVFRLTEFGLINGKEA
jgi:aquaporin Z